MAGTKFFGIFVPVDKSSNSSFVFSSGAKGCKNLVLQKLIYLFKVSQLHTDTIKFLFFWGASYKFTFQSICEGYSI